MDELSGVEIGFSVFSVESEIRRHAQLVPERVREGYEAIRFGYAAFHERSRERVQTEFVAAGFRERGNERFQIVRYGVSENDLQFFDGLSDDVFRRAFPAGMDECREVDVRVAVRKSDDGAVCRGDEDPYVLFERLFRKEDYGVGMSAVGFRRFPVIKRYRIFLRGVRPSRALGRRNFDRVDAVGMLRGVGEVDVPFEKVAIKLNDRSYPFSDELQSFVGGFSYRTRRPRYARERRPSVFGNGSQHGFHVSQHTVYTHDGPSVKPESEKKKSATSWVADSLSPLRAYPWYSGIPWVFA